MRQSGIDTEEPQFILGFSQAWGSTSLGFGGVGGSAITEAPTTVIALGRLEERTVFVFFGGRFAYKVHAPALGGTEKGWQQFWSHVANHNLLDCREAQKSYGAKL